MIKRFHPVQHCHSGLDPESSWHGMQSKHTTVNTRETCLMASSLKIAGQARNDRTGNNKIFTSIVLLITTIGALFSILRLPFPPAISIISPIESFKILANHLFTISERYQAYLYQYFTVATSPSNYENYIFVALFIIVILLAVLAIAAHKIKIIYALIFFTFTAIQIYFGIFAVPLWNIALYAAIAWAALRKANFAFISCAIIVTTIVALLFFPGANPFLTELSETIRDQFGRQQERQVIMDLAQQEFSPQGETTQMDIADDGLAGGQEVYIDHDYDERFAGSQIGTAFGQRLWILWLISLAFAVGFAIWFLQKLLSAFKRRALFYSPDCRIAVDAMFKHMISCVIHFGAEPKNLSYAQYAAHFPRETDYLLILDLWQRATYSNHDITENDKQQTRAFLNDTLNLLLKRKKPIARTAAKLQLFLL